MDAWINEDRGPRTAEPGKNGFAGPSSTARTPHSQWIDQVLSPESLRKAGYFDPDAVGAVRQKLPGMRRGIRRTGLEMGLTAVTATQLWHHLYIGGNLCDLPSGVPGSRFQVPGSNGHLEPGTRNSKL
jgi:hypothetical protein